MSTPGPRKFLSSSSSQFKIPKSAWRSPGPNAQTSRSSSSLKEPPSTQFAKTPRFATSTNDSIDEIDVSFEHRSSSSTEVRAQRTFRPSHGSSYDDLVDEDDDPRTDLSHSKVRLVQDEELQHPSCDHHETTRETARSGDNIEDVEANEFPQPTSKRLKTSTESNKHHDAILISSSGSEDDGNCTTHPSDLDYKPNQSAADPSDFDSDLDDLLPSSPTHTRPSTTSTTTPRFKPPAAPPSDHFTTKPIFKPPPPSLSGLNTTPLPETFSPSRRRGKRDYLPSGLADTVRNWVLELGTSISKPGANTSSPLKTVRVARVQHDVEGRCATIQDEDEDEQYLLVSQGQQSDASNVRTGDMVEINGGGTSWSIAVGIPTRCEAADGGEMEGSGDAEGARANGDRTVNVSVLWKSKQ